MHPIDGLDILREELMSVEEYYAKMKLHANKLTCADDNIT